MRYASVFRAYDIRGIYPDEVDEELYQLVGRAYSKVFQPRSVVVGMDARLSSASLKEALTEGLLECGTDVVDIGEAVTDMMYFAVGAYGHDGGIIVSASHNPAAYNGMKIVGRQAAAVSSDTGLLELRDVLNEVATARPSSSRGQLRDLDVLGDYVAHTLRFIDTSTLRPFKIVANANFGFVGRTVSLIAEKLDLAVTPLNFEPDGSFPKGPPDPLLPENRVETEDLVRASGAELGVAWDADADRVMFFDESGQYIPGVYFTALLADKLASRAAKPEPIIFDPRVVWPVRRAIRKAGAIPIMSKSGHAFIKDRMRKENGLFAGELSSHYYFRENFFADNGMIPFLLVLETLSQNQMPLSSVMAPVMENHAMSGEVNYAVVDRDAAMNRVRARFQSVGDVDEIDGLSVETDDWRFNIRPSNTEQYVRLNVEARDQETVSSVRCDVEECVLEDE